MIKIKFKKIYIINFVLIIQIICCVFGFFYEPKSTKSVVVPEIVLGMIAKVQITNNLQNFVWFFTNNLSILFIIFWLNYWSFGIVGTFWCIVTSFMTGSLIKIAFLNNNFWVSIGYIMLEFIAYAIVLISSAYFRFNRKYLEKHKRQKDMLKIMIITAIIILIAAIIETIAINLILKPIHKF